LSRNRYLYALVFVVGTGSLGAEIAVARLMAPFFGASTIVWANTIGVVLVALSIGYWYGGRLADRSPTIEGLARMVLAAAVLLAVVPFVAQPFLDISVEALDSISAGAFVGSLLAVLALVAVPVMLLGAASPYALRLAVPDVEHTGRVAGRLYAISTAGSLAGTMTSSLLLIPFVGTQRTFLVFALVIALAATAGLGLRFAPVPALLALSLALPVGLVKGSEDGEVIYEAETETQYAQVVEQEDGDLVLQLNEGQAIHSMIKPGTYLTDRYWDGLISLPFAALERPPERVAILGNAAGTAARMYGHYFPEARVDGVEIDGELTEIGRRYFDLTGPDLHTYTADARPWLRASDGDYDVIVVDAYRQPYIPFYLATREFFEEVRDKLAPGGTVVVNVGHPEGNDDLESAIGRTMADVLPTVARDPIEDANTLLLGSEAEASAGNLLAAAQTLPEDLRGLAVASSSRIGPRLAGGEVYTDDRAPVEWLVDASLAEVAQ
jgi:spermidine synthase